MKTNTLLPLGARGAFIAVGAAALFASLAMFAYADTAPSVDATAYNASNVAVTSSPIGSGVMLVANVASSSTTTLPTGTVTFNRYDNTSCSGSPVVQPGVSLANGIATSSMATMGAGGLSYIAAYNGDADNVAASSTCKAVTATGVSVGLASSLSANTINAGGSVTQNVTIQNATSNAGGSVAYTVYTNPVCTTLWGNAGSKPVMSAAASSSDPFSFNFPGSYWWQAVYSGDANNNAATSSCLSLTVLATSSNPTPGPGSISGTVYSDTNHNEKLDGGESGIAGFTINLYNSANANSGKANKTPFMSATTDANGYFSFANLADGTYSVEEINKAGWHQDTGDYMKLVIKNGNSFPNTNFANTAVSTSTNQGHGHDGDNNNDDNGNKGDNGNHWGWQNFINHVGHLPWGIFKKQ